MSKDSAVTPLRPRRPCPECGKPSTRENYPFCSPRCKDVDLNRWLKGAYAIPVRDDEDDEDGTASKPAEE
ncbi:MULTISPECIES: DNA gyrase inhibitor YacG [unclassified Mesorhizobium]|uniref:DNA gyrase inhibitor YacG n=1 Tax=unclassified Mesorhizobium TaxID=325217 RepID=UPI0006FA0471|nr:MULTISPECIES: DNA gyrase inhibitor YacG [unclassified Mesorhizobium]KQZ16110.1 zinc-binding protein [Mesorhizobium sp. Root1471]KQZ38627.1 zinc-binding protein [Mesorhizobium sp. Root554]